MVGDLPRTSTGRSAAATRRRWGCSLVAALSSVVLVAGPLRGADDRPASAAGVPAAASKAHAETRRLTGCAESPTDDGGREIAHRGRAAIEIKGRARGGESPGALSDLAVFDLSAGRIVSSICFTNASTRKHGEAIFSLADASGLADRFVRALLPGAKLELESVRRHSAGTVEHIYYEARYLSANGPVPFHAPPVRLLLNATTGTLFRLDVDPDWLDPGEQPTVRISRKAAEKIAAVVLRNHDLAPAFGTGAVLGAFAAAEMLTVRANDWLGLSRMDAEARARVAWVVPFRIEGGAAPGLQSIFIDAATGLVLGGLSAEPAEQSPR